ncbi:MAG: hypothetical protein Fur0025_10660 [Oscillatoriaceae cyanobacterium]
MEASYPSSSEIITIEREKYHSDLNMSPNLGFGSYDGKRMANVSQKNVIFSRKIRKFFAS